MNRIQPSSTLFPYTTLFRSKRREQTAPEVQAIFFRRRHQPRRPPHAKIRPGSPAPAMGPGTVEVTDQVPGEKTLRAVSTLADWAKSVAAIRAVPSTWQGLRGVKAQVVMACVPAATAINQKSGLPDESVWT